jgi:Flp pilus assembly protein TadG
MLRWITRSERGQAMVETAIVLPVVVLLVFAMLDAGRVFNAWILVTNASREGARSAAARQTEAQVLTRIDAALGGGMTYDVTLDNVQGPSGTPVTVEVGTDVTIVTPLISAFFSGSSVRIDNTAVMQLE